MQYLSVKYPSPVENHRTSTHPWRSLTELPDLPCPDPALPLGQQADGSLGSKETLALNVEWPAPVGMRPRSQATVGTY